MPTCASVENAISCDRELSVFEKNCSIRLLTLLGLLLSLTACANTPGSKQLEDSLAPDPKLKDNPELLGDSTPSPSPGVTPTQLPEDFPREIPQYNNAELQSVSRSTSERSSPQTEETPRVTTVWETGDRGDRVRQFYQTHFEDNQWEILPTPATETQGDRSVSARKDNLQVTVAIVSQPSDTPTEFTLTYELESATSTAKTPETPKSSTTTEKAAETTLETIPEPLRPYVSDLQQLGIASLKATSSDADAEAWNQAIARAQYAEWLIAANNRFFDNQPSKQIRLATPSTQPAFQDVPATHPQFAAIQGLADAGIIPSSLTGENTAVNFRPDAPLSREDAIAWKVPLDFRQGLPKASVEAVREAWGFQDVPKIDPAVLPAILADYQNGELSNLRRAFGYTRIFQPKKEVTRAEAAATLWYFGDRDEGLSATDVVNRQPTPQANPQTGDRTTAQPSEPPTTQENQEN
ncbi:S-layer homology domain-containing protein [Oxynema sp. CENA135]|uniref:S-layer homology domain-containing protein n=1 Tax=Oxynema sp. CENA135 TaxID=984206 RepID=UPI001F35A622|nr:S-layer homology domain-containing protein [Oxynema sp. CENA135]